MTFLVFDLMLDHYQHRRQMINKRYRSWIIILVINFGDSLGILYDLE